MDLKRREAASGSERAVSWGMRHVVRRTGLTKEQVILVEELGLLGHVRRWRTDRRRAFDADQVVLLTRVAELRSALALTFQEAGSLARELGGGPAHVGSPRLDQLRRQALSASRSQLEVALLIEELSERREAMRTAK